MCAVLKVSCESPAKFANFGHAYEPSEQLPHPGMADEEGEPLPFYHDCECGVHCARVYCMRSS